MRKVLSMLRPSSTACSTMGLSLTFSSSEAGETYLPFSSLNCDFTRPVMLR